MDFRTDMGEWKESSNNNLHWEFKFDILWEYE